MLIKQLYTGCLSEAAYFIESNGEAAVIDPLRDTDVYIDLARQHNAKIKYIFETHFHADFVSGHLDLSKATGAPIVYGPGTETAFPIHLAVDGETFAVGDLSISVLHTPGHTIESTCYLLKDNSGRPHAVFTGDTLFVGDVGRPDLSSGDKTNEELASVMYDSLHNKLMTLPEDVLVYPAHGAGSSCGKNLSEEKFSTIGQEKRSNYALQPQSREQFIDAVTNGLPEPPKYFNENARINREGYESLQSILDKGLQSLSVPQFKEYMQQNDVVVVDTRKGTVFTQGFIPGSIYIGLDGRFAEWAGVLISLERRILLVADAGTEKETVIRLARVGFAHMLGFLEGGFEEWKRSGEEIDMIIDVEADELAMDLPFDDNLVVVDVRRDTEFGDGHVAGAMNIPLDDFTDVVNIAGFEETDNLYIHCGSGYRSVIAASLIKRQGLHNIRNVLGGFEKIKEQKGIEVVKENRVLN
jgi:hydroxyacylglutathione hydrolase